MTFRLPTWALPAALAALLLAGWWIIREHDTRVRAEARTEEEARRTARAIARSLADSTTAAELARGNASLRAALDSTRRADSVRVAQASRRSAEARQEALRAGRDLRSTLRGLEASVSPPLVPAVRTAVAQLDTLEAGYALADRAREAQVLGLVGMLAASDSAGALWREEALAEREAATSAREALARQTERVRLLERLAEPPWHVTARRAIPWALGAAALAVVGWEVVR